MNGPVGPSDASQRVEMLACDIVDAVAAGDDLGDTLSLALGMAANRLDGVESLLVGRPGSWESDIVRKLAQQYAAHVVIQTG